MNPEASTGRDSCFGHKSRGDGIAPFRAWPSLVDRDPGRPPIRRELVPWAIESCPIRGSQGDSVADITSNFNRLPLDVFLRGLRRVEDAEPGRNRFDRLGHAPAGIDPELVAPAPTETVFITCPALEASRQRRPPAFTKHNFAEEKRHGRLILGLRF